MKPWWSRTVLSVGLCVAPRLLYRPLPHLLESTAVYLISAHSVTVINPSSNCGDSISHEKSLWQTQSEAFWKFMWETPTKSSFSSLSLIDQEWRQISQARFATDKSVLILDFHFGSFFTGQEWPEWPNECPDGCFRQVFLVSNPARDLESCVS